MTFSTRNAYYLRVSNYRVIPLFLYLDERHVSPLPYVNAPDTDNSRWTGCLIEYCSLS